MILTRSSVLLLFTCESVGHHVCISDQRTTVVSTPLDIKLSANCEAKLVTTTEASGGRTETWFKEYI